jgi:hypothetical protein
MMIAPEWLDVPMAQQAEISTGADAGQSPGQLFFAQKQF